ncbi:hypothetical protein LWC05_09815 [Acetobacter sicerae]|uniref:DUF3072 domain-containing protein n=1 Tax=Acetobacter sicerae TaxID=85325 RepID=A0ABS8VVK6_9PROT|nr:hypothetical protein [Acetobacter sicerae]MCE0744176.1 hypothetical protein [Acetobacter sicerae]
MSRLTQAERDALPDSAFALPGRRYPIPDKTHARDALARASEFHHRGELSDEEYETIVRRSREVLGEDE